MSRWRERRHETTLPRHCEPPGRANARPMTGSAKQSISPRKERKDGLLRRFAPRNDEEGERRHETTLARHCERSEAIHCLAKKEWIASSLRSSQRRGGREAARKQPPVIASAAKQSIAPQRKNGLLRGACHRARIRATRWLCAEHDRQLGGESLLSSLIVAKD